MSWNYRIIGQRLPPPFEDDICFGIAEVYYDDDGKVKSWTENYMRVSSDSAGGVGDVLRMMLSACDKPTLEDVDDELVEWRDRPLDHQERSDER